jgi:transcriptional regulator with GAF, ATPase, and Fis domain
MRRGAKPSKAKVEAKRAVAAKSPKDDGARVRDLEERLAGALDQQAATSDILRAISRSQTDVRPVFEAIVQSAVRLLGSHAGVLTRITGDQIVLGALTSTDEAGDAVLRARYPLPLTSEAPTARAIRDRARVNSANAQVDPRMPDTQHAVARNRGYRSLAAVPLLHNDEPLGAIAVTRREAGGFTGDEISLLQTFADQAVIAIENARLLGELQEKNKALTAAHAQVMESLEQQTATAEILRVIASSPTDVQPVFDTILASATTLLCGFVASLTRRVGDDVHMAAFTSMGESLDAAVRQSYPVSIDSPNPHSVAIRVVNHISSRMRTRGLISPSPSGGWLEREDGAVTSSCRYGAVA